MERINVSEEFRMFKSNCSFKMEFSTKVDMRKAYEAMEAAVMPIVDENGYYAIWLQDLADCCENDCFNIKNGILYSNEFNEYVPAMCKAVAEALPDADFEVYAYYDDLQCYWVDEFEASYSDHHLVIVGTLMDDDNGYFCPECGCQVANCGEIEDLFDSDEIECEDCDEIIKV